MKPSGMSSFSFTRSAPRFSSVAVASCAAFAALMTGVVVNALFLQHEKHQAPLFASFPAGVTSILPPARPARAESALATPASAAVSAPAPHALPIEAPAPAPRPESEAAVPRKPEARRIDAIGALLRGGAPAATEQASPRLKSAQKALAGLGYAVTADGVDGPQTRAALEAFEKKLGLPVTGTLTPRTLRKLSIAAGVAIE